MPSTRLISQAHHNFKHNEIKWIPWKFRISVNKADEISAGRSSKVPKLEGLEPHSLLMDDPPAMEISNTSMGLNAVRSLMDIHNTALSLVGAAHLPTLRAYSIKSLSLLSVKLDPEKGLRPPSRLLGHAELKKDQYKQIFFFLLDAAWLNQVRCPGGRPSVNYSRNWKKKII